MLALTAQLPSGLRPSFQSSSIFGILFLWGSALPATKILYEKFSCVWLGWVFHLSGSSRRPHPLTGRMQLRDGPAPNVVRLWLDLHPLHPSIPPSRAGRFVELHSWQASPQEKSQGSSL